MAIIAILAAIAVPNFLEAQVRAKVSRVRADVRSTATAIESYKIDNNKYPPAAEYPYAAYTNGNYNGSYYSSRISSWLSTPIAYLTSMTNDVFVPAGTHSASNPHWYRYIYFNYEEMIAGVATPNQNFGRKEATGGWLFYSYGPDQDTNQAAPKLGTNGTFTRYDPTNGTVSWGNIIRTNASPEGYVPAHPLVTGNPKGPN